MPLFEQDRNDAEAYGPRGAWGQDPEHPDIPWGETMGAAFRQGNTVVSHYADQTRRAFPPVEGYSPSDDITANDPYFKHLDRFLGSASPSETAAIKRQIDQEESDKRILGASGWAGTVAGLVAGAADPTMWWAPARLERGAVAGARMLRGAAEGAATFGAQTTAQEALLQSSQQTRTLGESAGNVAGATVLGGLIGPAASLLTREEHAALAAKVDTDRAATARHAEGLPATFDRVNPEAGESPGSATAAAVSPSESAVKESPAERLKAAGTDRAAYNRVRNEIAGLSKDEVNAIQHEYIGGREAWSTKREALVAIENAFREREYQAAKMVQVGKANEALFGPAAAGAEATSPEALAAAPRTPATQDLQLAPALGIERFGLDAKTRGMNSPLSTARRATAELGEIPIETTGNLRGETTTIGGGPALETQAKIDLRTAHVGAMSDLREAWKDLRFQGNKAPWFAEFRDRMGMLNRPADLPTYEDFTKMVGEAMARGDTHTIPQVQMAAQQLRQRMEPWADRAEDALQGFAKREGEPYFPHDWNKRLIIGQRPEFVDFLTNFFAGEQAAKRSIQSRLQLHSGALEAHEAEIKKLSERIRKMEADLDTDEELKAELSGLNRFAHLRATTLRESNYRNEGGIRVGAPDKNIEKARGGAVFETEIRARHNKVADRVSAYTAKLDELEAKLDAEHARAAAVRERIETEIGKWKGKSAKEAKAALKSRADYEAERQRKAAAQGKPAPKNRLTGADAEVDKAVKRILESRQDLSVDELRERAHQTTDHILGTPDGRIYNEGGDFAMGGPASNLRSSEAHRTLNIPNAEAWPWINQNAEEVFNRWSNTMIPDVLIAERFGDVEMKSVMQQILDEHGALSEAKRGNEKELTKLNDAKDRAITDIAFMRDKLRGVHGIPSNPTEAKLKQFAGAVKNLNVLTSLGMAGVNSVTDAGGVMMRYGLTRTFADGFVPYFRSLVSGGALNREALAQAKAAGIAIDTELAARHHGIAGVLDNYAPASPVERALQVGADRLQLFNMLAPWTDRIKTIAMTVAAPEMKQGMEALVAGTADARQLRLLGAANIDTRLASRILKQYEQHGNVVDGVHLPNVTAWTDRAAREAFQGALIREADIAVVTPGIGDAPNWMSHPVLGLLGQFKQFTAASHTRMLIANLQRRDAQSLGGLIGMMGLGMLSYKVGELTGGQKTSDKPSDWIKEAASRANLLGWFEEANAFASKLTRGQLDLYRLTGSDHMLSKYASRSGPAMLLGPTYSKLERLYQATGAAAAGDWTSADTHAVRQLIALQNVVWLRGVLNEVEKGINSSFGIPEQEQRH